MLGVPTWPIEEAPAATLLPGIKVIP